MALSVGQGFAEFMQRLVPLESQRVAATKHRQSVESSLRNAFSVNSFRETGSFRHGTGVRNHCDVDLLVSLGNPQPASSDTALDWLKGALSSSFPYTTIRISRPAVVVEFAGGTETWEVTPGFITHKGGAGVFVYEIPGASNGWMESAPAEHLAYVNKINDAEAKVGGAKKLARLAKAWKYYCNVPISSFYLEMRAAKYMSGEKYYNPIFDVCGFFEHLESISLSTMNDPAGVASRFYPCSSSTKEAEALSKVRSASTRARKALNAQLAGKEGEAFTWLDLVFGGRFPSRY